MMLRLIECKPVVRSNMPYGWELDTDGPRPVPEEQWVISYARKMREFGYTFREIAQQLIKDGHWTREGERWRAGDIVELLDQADETLWARWRKRKAR
jgi:hypothetical protein